MGTVEALVILGTMLVVGIGWLVRAAGELSRRKVEWVRTNARVADASTVDIHDIQGNHVQTTDRVVVVFELPGGERHAADKTWCMSQHEKDILLPDAVVPIRYDARAPDDFEIEWAELRAAAPLAAPVAVERGEPKPRPVYSPPR